LTRLLELREAAKNCSNVAYRTLLRNAADALEARIATFNTELSDDALRMLNCDWMNSIRLLREVPPEGNPAPVAPAVEEEMRMAA
jgi:hypothetical protein